MKWFYFLLLITLSGCLTIYFDAPQPEGRKSLTEFPEKLTGIYLSKDNDTIYVNKDRYFYFEKKQNRRYRVDKLISDSLIIKKYGKGWVMNIMEEDTPYYYVFLIQRKDNGDLIVFMNGQFYDEEYYEGDEEDKSETDGAINDFFEITEFKKIGDSEYWVDPSPSEFKKLVKKGFFVDTLGYFQKIK